eukprot:695720-Prymnesium_polylepis.1
MALRAGRRPAAAPRRDDAARRPPGGAAVRLPRSDAAHDVARRRGAPPRLRAGEARRPAARASARRLRQDARGLLPAAVARAAPAVRRRRAGARVRLARRCPEPRPQGLP